MISNRPEIKQKQSLAMTPQLVQAIRLLQFSSVELEQYLSKEVLENPLLGIDGTIQEAGLVDPDSSVDQGGAAPNKGEPSSEGFADRDADQPSWSGPNQERGEASPESSMAWGRGEGPLERSGISAGPQVDALEFIPEKPSLIAQLEQRIVAYFVDPTDRAIALGLLSNLDNAGYLAIEVADLAERLGADAARCERVLELCQSLAPSGMFARSLAECLRLQLKEKNRLDPAMETLLDNLDELAAGRSGRVRMRCGVDHDDFLDMLAEIRALNPKPGYHAGDLQSQTIVPDILVSQAQAGSWRVELNDHVLPRVLIDRDYAATVIPTMGRSADKQYVSNCLQRANWLEKCLDQRAQTILKVSKEIIRQQDAFLRDGVASLKPLTLNEVAETIGVHGSTVSRATANKYISTPRGLFSMKFFFSSSLSSSNADENLSSEAVKHRVKQLTDNESPDSVLSDDAIAAILSDEGIVVARRTVAKYRDALGIPSSAQRRREIRALSAG